MSVPLTVFNGRGNRIDLALTQGGTPIDAGFITGVALRIFDKKYGALVRYIEGRASEPANEASLFDYGTSSPVPGSAVPLTILSMQLGLASPQIPPANAYWCDLIIFSSAYPLGLSWAQFYIAVIAATP